MRIGQFFHISLARKCQILFGIAVVLIIATALLVPWLYMGILVSELNVAFAKQAALAARSGLEHTTDWKSAQLDLKETWPSIAREQGFPENMPRLIYVGGCPAADAQWDAFEAEAIAQLCEHPNEFEAHKLEDIPGLGRLTRYALAVRDPSIEDPQAGFLGVVSVTMAAQAIWNYTYLYQLVMVGAALVAGIMAIVVFYLITQYLVLSPVRDLKEVSKRISSGDQSVLARIDTGDEFEDLGEAFNEMVAHLNSSQEMLRKMNKSLDSKLGELAESNVALFEANRLKSEFLANVSHELRTPLTSIIGFAELLRDAADSPKPTDPVKLKRFSDNILSSGRMLLDFINDLLDLTKIEAGKMRLHRTRFPVADVCEAVVDFTRPLADKKHLTVRLCLPDDPPVMNSDAGKIQQIIYNLMSNAIKFTPPGGYITISLQVDPPDHVVLRVKDTGPGIHRDLHGHIFEKFRQLDGSATREHGGTGLGLAISRDLAGLLGGKITLESDEGTGAEFIVRLPIESPQPEPV